MKKYLILCLIAFCQLAVSQNYDDLFTNQVLRVDFLLHGMKNQTKVTVVNFKKEPIFTGNHKNLIFPNYGTFTYQLLDAKSKKVIFSKGFAPIFNEWQLTPDAKQKPRAFENVAIMPFPKNDVIFQVLERDFNEKFQVIYQENIKANDYNISAEAPISYPVVKILDSKKAPQNAIDLAIVAEGYTENEMDKFIADVNKMVTYMFSIAPYSLNKDKFNIYAIKSPSLESGPDIPGKNIYKNTILNSHFYTFDTERYLTTPSLFKLADITAATGCDQVYVLVNTPIYGGGAFYNSVNLVSSGHQLSPEIFLHEFGHGFIGLGDEYYNDSANMEIDRNLKVEVWEPNLTSLVNFNKKWKDLVKKSTPIPTPRTEKFKNETGAFEGGGYITKGLYSPAQDCQMKSSRHRAFCAVCTREIEKTILLHCQ